MAITNTFTEMTPVNKDTHAVLTDNPILEVDNWLKSGMNGNNDHLAMFTHLIERDEAFSALLNTETSQLMRAIRANGAQGDFTAMFAEDKDGNLILQQIPSLHFTSLTAEPDDCCVVAGDLQACRNNQILKPLCLERCRSGNEEMISGIAKLGDNGLMFQAYKAMLSQAGVTKSQMPSVEDFMQLSMIAQFIFLNMITFLNGMLEVEQNGNIVRRFNGLKQIYSNPDILTVDGANGIGDAMKQVDCRVNLVGGNVFAGGFWIADKIAFSAVQSEIQPKDDGNYPTGWTVVDSTREEYGRQVPTKEYYYNGMKIIKSDLLYIDEKNPTGTMYFIPQSMGIFSAVPLDFGAKFMQDEWNKAVTNGGHSPFIHWDTSSKAYPDCWSECQRLTNMGTVVAEDTNSLMAITNIKSNCDLEKAMAGLGGLINPNSISPFVK